jgi:hypothetical protein
MSGNTYVMVVYASLPWGESTQWRRPKEVPVAFQRRLARAR